MSDLIDRQAAITLPVMPKEHREYQTYNLDDAYEQGWLDLQKCIEKLPSAQPEIIRCKECKHYHVSFCKIWSRYGTVQTRETGFCYMAERKDNE